jgi:hypothetical protein
MGGENNRAIMPGNGIRVKAGDPTISTRATDCAKTKNRKQPHAQ